MTFASTGSVTLKLKQKVLITKTSVRRTQHPSLPAQPCEPFARAGKDLRTLELVEREELRDAHRQQSEQYGEVADRVDEEADADAREEHDAGDAGPKMREALKSVELSAIAFGRSSVPPSDR